MKNLVLKIPTAIFIVLVLLPLLIFAMQQFSGEVLLELQYYQLLSILGSVVSWLWLISVVDYFYSKVPTFKFIRWIYILLALDFLLLVVKILNFYDFIVINHLVLFAIQAIVMIIAIVFITLLIRIVFFERAVWFIVLELLILIIGITTLTPEIKRHEQELLGDEI